MKTRVVVWGENDKAEKLLLAIELKAEDNAVVIKSFPEAVATEAFHKKLMDSWRSGESIPWPADHQEINRPLSLTESLLPDGLKVMRSDIISRAQTEWHFVVLSHKLSSAYKSELEDLKEKISRLDGYEAKIWEELKGFWDKVQVQVREKNLFWDHFRDLKSGTNELFDALKEKRKKLNDTISEKSRENLAFFGEKLDVIEDKIEKGLGLQPIFQQLRDLQGKLKDHEFTRGDQNKLWKRIDKAFKAVKTKRFGDGAQAASNAVERLTKRYDGLLGAVDRMTRSINRDQKDLMFETKRLNASDGQLESQIRAAKITMIEERIRSKQEKLDDMNRTKAELEDKIERAKEKEADRQEKTKIREEQTALKEKVKSDIASKQISSEDEAKLARAAAEIKEAKSKKAKKATAQTKVPNLVLDIAAATKLLS